MRVFALGLLCIDFCNNICQQQPFARTSCASKAIRHKSAPLQAPHISIVRPVTMLLCWTAARLYRMRQHAVQVRLALGHGIVG